MRSPPLPSTRPRRLAVLVASATLLLLGCPLSSAPPDDDDTEAPVDCSAAAWSTGWERLGDGPVLEPQGWEGTIVRPTSVVATDEGLRLYYLSASVQPCGAGGDCLARTVGLAQSDDGLEWTRVGDGPVLDRWDDEADVGHGDARQDPASGTWSFVYGRSEGGAPVGVARATSLDGLDWTAADDTIELSLGAPGSWDADFTGAPALLLGDDERFWFTGAVGDRAAAGLAVRQGAAWVRDGAAPVLGTGSPGTYDERGVANPSIVNVEGCLVMAYKATSFRPEPDNETVGVAVSADGRTWERGPAPALEIEQPWESDGVVDPALWVADGAVWMAYGALGDSAQSVALARRAIPRLAP